MKLSLKQLLLVESYRENASISSSIDRRRRSILRSRRHSITAKRTFFWHVASHESDQNVFSIHAYQLTSGLFRDEAASWSRGPGIDVDENFQKTISDRLPTKRQGANTRCSTHSPRENAVFCKDA